LHKDGWDGGKEKIQCAISEGNVQRDEEHEGRIKEHLGRANEAVEEGLEMGFLLGIDLVAAAKVVAAEFLFQALDLALDKDTGIGFSVVKLVGRNNDDRSDEDDPEGPAPADGLRDEAANNGSNGWAWE